MQAKRQNPNFALLSLWSLAKMVIEMVARGVVVSTVWIWVSDKIWTMGVTKKPHSSDTDKTVQLFRNLKPPWGQQFAKCHKHVHFLKGTRLWNFWVNPELKKKIRLSIEQPRYLNVLATGYLRQSGSCFTFFQETSFWQKGYGPIPICNGNSKLNFLLFYCALCYV